MFSIKWGFQLISHYEYNWYTICTPSSYCGDSIESTVVSSGYKVYKISWHNIYISF